MTQRYRKTRPIVLLLAGWFLLGIILVANTLARANADARDSIVAGDCGTSAAVPR
ncbi:MAG: hypothetical protein ACREPX_06225 [Rhodanobacteraceae bacterium]